MAEPFVNSLFDDITLKSVLFERDIILCMNLNIKHRHKARIFDGFVNIRLKINAKSVSILVTGEWLPILLDFLRYLQRLNIFEISGLVKCKSNELSSQEKIFRICIKNLHFWFNSSSVETPISIKIPGITSNLTAIVCFRKVHTAFFFLILTCKCEKIRQWSHASHNVNSVELFQDHFSTLVERNTKNFHEFFN